MISEKKIEGALTWEELDKLASPGQAVLLSTELWPILLSELDALGEKMFYFEPVTDNKLVMGGRLGMWKTVPLFSEPLEKAGGLINTDEFWIVPADQALRLLESMNRTSFELKAMERPDITKVTAFNKPG